MPEQSRRDFLKQLGVGAASMWSMLAGSDGEVQAAEAGSLIQIVNGKTIGASEPVAGIIQEHLAYYLKPNGIDILIEKGEHSEGELTVAIQTIQRALVGTYKDPSFNFFRVVATYKGKLSPERTTTVVSNCAYRGDKLNERVLAHLLNGVERQLRVVVPVYSRNLSLKDGVVTDGKTEYFRLKGGKEVQAGDITVREAVGVDKSNIATGYLLGIDKNGEIKWATYTGRGFSDHYLHVNESEVVLSDMVGYKNSDGKHRIATIARHGRLGLAAYPGIITSIDAETGAPLMTAYHPGHLNHIAIAKGVTIDGGEQDVIIAAGMNNDAARYNKDVNHYPDLVVLPTEFNDGSAKGSPLYPSNEARKREMEYGCVIPSLEQIGISSLEVQEGKVTFGMQGETHTVPIASLLRRGYVPLADLKAPGK